MQSVQPFSKSRARFTSTAAAALLLALTACSSEDTSTSENASSAAFRAPVTQIEVQPRELSRALSLSAPVQSRTHARLAARTGGTVLRLGADVGDRVEDGARLAELDTSEQAAELGRAQAHATEAQAAYERAREMRDRELLSAADYQAAQAQLAATRGEARLWRTRVEHGQVQAPFAGTVTARHVERGEAIDAGQVLFELADMEALVLHLGVSELDVVHLQSGDPVPVRFDALPDVRLDGEVARVFPAADADSRLVTVEVALPGGAHEQGVRPGFLARVSTRIDRREGVLALPSAAVGEDNGTRYVFVIEDGQLRRQVVAVGPSRGDWMEIREGLRFGQTVLATNPADMRDGQAVRVIRTLEP